MEDYIEQIKSELKRADHLFYVSLKYTRTVDVLRSIIERLMNALEVGMEALLVKTQKRRKTLEMPNQQRKRCSLIKEIYANDQKLNDFVDFYLELRNIIQSKYDKASEFRRNVTMITHLGPENDLDVNIDLLQEYYEKTKVFEEYILEKIS